MSDHHGIPEEAVDVVVKDLGIREHTAEDCRISRTLHHSMSVPVVVYGAAVFVLRHEAWEKYYLDAATRRRLILGGDQQIPLSEITLRPWSEARH